MAELLAGQLPRAAHVRGDVFRWMAVSGREELLPEETTEARAQPDLCYLLSALVADGYAHHGWTAVVQDIILGDDLTRYIDRVHTRPLFVVVLAPAIAVVRAREATRPKAGYGVWTVEARDHALRAETPPTGLWLDTSEHTPTLTVSAFSTTSRPRLGRAADPRHHAARPPKPASSQP